MPDRADETSLGASEDTPQQVTKVETASQPVRRYRNALFQTALLSALCVFGLLAFLIETTPAFPVDLQITRAIQGVDSPLFAGFMRLISWPGFLPQSILITLTIALVLFIYRLHWESAASLLAAGFSGAINELVKNLIRRPRPGVDLVDVFAVLESYSFPSGHVMFYTIQFGFIWYLTYTLLKKSPQRSLLLGLFGCLVLSVGFSRIYLGQHWASDVLGAYLLGGLILVGIIALYQWGRTRFFVPQQASKKE